jgi:hypothetical protein
VDRVGIGYSATTADPSTALRFGRDDKGRAVTFRKGGDPDGQSWEWLLRNDCRSLHCVAVWMDRVRSGAKDNFVRSIKVIDPAGQLLA